MTGRPPAAARRDGRHAGRGALLAALLAIASTPVAAAAATAEPRPATRTLQAGALHGAIGAEWRHFPEQAGAGAGAAAARPSAGAETQGSLFASLDWQARWRSLELVVQAFARRDDTDHRRSHADVRQALLRHRGDGFVATAGIGRVSWGATDAVHLVDIVNQTDFVGDFAGSDKLGQPLLSLQWPLAGGSVEALLLPGARPRTFPGHRGRPRFPLPVDAGARFKDGAGRDDVGGALRLQQALAGADVGVSLFHGTTREPTLVVAPAGDRLLATYAPITQLGADVQLARGDWLLKAEGIVRSGQSRRFAAAAAGVEYTLPPAAAGRLAVGLLAEYVHDARDRDPSRAPYTFADDDVFVGLRVRFNDLGDSQALLGALVDRDTGGAAVTVDASTRLGTAWTLSLRARLFAGVDAGDVLSTFRDDDHLQLRLVRHF